MQRFFELNIYTKKNENYQLMSIERREFDPILKYFTGKKVSIKSTDEDKNLKDLLPNISNSSSNRRNRTAPEDVPMELPSGKLNL